MPVKLIILAKKKAGLSRQEFIDYYEGHHAPLAARLLPFAYDYRRSYPKLAIKNGTASAEDFDCDAVVELWFEDKTTYRSFTEAMTDPETARQIAEDEERFLDRSAMIAMISEEFVS